GKRCSIQLSYGDGDPQDLLRPSSRVNLALRNRRLRAAPVDAVVALRVAAAVAVGLALLQLAGAARLRAGADEPRVGLGAAVAAPALVAADAADAVAVARIDRPERARVAGEQLLSRQIERRVARIRPRRRVEVDGGDPELLGRRRLADVVEARVAPVFVDG